MIDEKDEIRSILKNALREDLDEAGDITSQAIFKETDFAKAQIRSKATGVLSGAYLIKPLFELVDSTVEVELLCDDGQALTPGRKICSLSGPVRAILAGERTILNLLQKLSGIATITSSMVTELANTNTRLLDTRKTTPGIRLLEKKAVVHGGGSNHRFGLFDMILIKDTHVRRAGGVEEALSKALKWRGEKKIPLIEIEVQSVEEFLQAATLGGADRIMLDNMTSEEIKMCVEERNGRTLPVSLEVSGNVTAQTLPAVANTGVDFISSGAITHSAPALDIHLVIT